MAALFDAVTLKLHVRNRGTTGLASGGRSTPEPDSDWLRSRAVGSILTGSMIVAEQEIMVMRP
jgi:hypothetical protein